MIKTAGKDKLRRGYYSFKDFFDFRDHKEMRMLMEAIIETLNNLGQNEKASDVRDLLEAVCVFANE